jgi:hypothetical protein
MDGVDCEKPIAYKRMKRDTGRRDPRCPKK